MQEHKKLSLDDRSSLLALGKALSSGIRLDMLELLEERPLYVNEIAEALGIPASSAAVNVKVLEEAGLISTTLKPGVHGSMKICSVEQNCLELILKPEPEETGNVEIIEMPVGNYVDYKVMPTCGIVSEQGHIDQEDEPRVFYNPRRTEAKLLWLGDGFLEYRFPNTITENQKLKSISVAAEICSEAIDYDMSWRSDITLWVNGIEAGTWKCPSDYGDRRGRLNPEWWPDKNSQYGEWKTWKISRNGTYLDGVQLSSQGIEDYGFDDLPYISVRIGIKEDAEHKGGLNIFGNAFGDHPRDIEMKLEFI